jgi:hypothetical protein
MTFGVGHDRHWGREEWIESEYRARARHGYAFSDESPSSDLPLGFKRSWRRGTWTGGRREAMYRSAFDVVDDKWLIACGESLGATTWVDG